MNKMVNGVLALLAFAVLSCDLLNQVGSGASGGSVPVKGNEEPNSNEVSSDRNDESDKSDAVTTDDKVVGAKKKVDVVADETQELQNSPKGNKQEEESESNTNPTLGVPSAAGDDGSTRNVDESGFGISMDEFIRVDVLPPPKEEKKQGESVDPFTRVVSGGSFLVTEDLHDPDTTETEEEN
ncbi:hypothetical protein LKV13_03715 [Borrelia sp. BU AG58]|uniref:hypothetical protein n=1 Tax=Borrelia sp. BU AG58 TaxID=2887345 RepID=UPI001E382FF1|nr:hypothetical protein [Borrelia sp. BU AG58]UER67873.1 hypothetical protein LKV13_03715 [Borrelia sp. BU AG58]